MREIQWHEVRKFLTEQIDYCTNRCMDVDIEDRERLIQASELRAYTQVLNLQGKGAGIDERR